MVDVYGVRGNMILRQTEVGRVVKFEIEEYIC